MNRNTVTTRVSLYNVDECVVAAIEWECGKWLTGVLSLLKMLSSWSVDLVMTSSRAKRYSCRCVCVRVCVCVYVCERERERERERGPP